MGQPAEPSRGTESGREALTTNPSFYRRPLPPCRRRVRRCTRVTSGAYNPEEQLDRGEESTSSLRGWWWRRRRRRGADRGAVCFPTVFTLFVAMRFERPTGHDLRSRRCDRLADGFCPTRGAGATPGNTHHALQTRPRRRGPGLFERGQERAGPGAPAGAKPTTEKGAREPVRRPIAARRTVR